MKRITDRKAKETIDRYLECGLTTDPDSFHIHQPYLFEYIYLIQDKLEGKEREILRTLASMIYCVMSEFGEVPLVTRDMIDEALSTRDERNMEKAVNDTTRDDMPGVFPQYSLYSAFSTFIFSLFLTKKGPAFSEKEKTLIGVLLHEIMMLIFLYDNYYPHRKLDNGFIKHPDENFGRIAEIGKIIIQPLYDQFISSRQFMELTPDGKNASLMIISHYTGLMRFIHATEPREWEAEHLEIFIEQQKVELEEEIFGIEKDVLAAFFDFSKEKDLLPKAEKLLEIAVK